MLQGYGNRQWIGQKLVFWELPTVHIMIGSFTSCHHLSSSCHQAPQKDELVSPPPQRDGRRSIYIFFLVQRLCANGHPSNAALHNRRRRDRDRYRRKRASEEYMRINFERYLYNVIPPKIASDSL